MNTKRPWAGFTVEWGAGPAGGRPACPVGRGRRGLKPGFQPKRTSPPGRGIAFRHNNGAFGGKVSCPRDPWAPGAAFLRLRTKTGGQDIPAGERRGLARASHPTHDHGAGTGITTTATFTDADEGAAGARRWGDLRGWVWRWEISTNDGYPDLLVTAVGQSHLFPEHGATGALYRRDGKRAGESGGHGRVQHVGAVVRLRPGWKTGPVLWRIT